MSQSKQVFVSGSDQQPETSLLRTIRMLEVQGSGGCWQGVRAKTGCKSGRELRQIVGSLRASPFRASSAGPIFRCHLRFLQSIVGNELWVVFLGE